MLSFALVAAVSGALLTGCFAEPAAAERPHPSPDAVDRPAPAPTPAGEQGVDDPRAPETTDAVGGWDGSVIPDYLGSRNNPVPPGTLVLLGPGSPFTVGSRRATIVHEDYAVLPLAIHIDWAILQDRADDAEALAFSPASRFDVVFVTGSGRVLFPYRSPFPPGPVSENTDVIDVDVTVLVPRTDVAGGVWEVIGPAPDSSAYLAVGW